MGKIILTLSSVQNVHIAMQLMKRDQRLMHLHAIDVKKCSVIFVIRLFMVLNISKEKVSAIMNQILGQTFEHVFHRCGEAVSAERKRVKMREKTNDEENI
jgi:hypothetical protein